MTTAPKAAANPTAKPWESAKGGEGSQLDPLAARFVESLSYDTRLYAADIRGSLAHARMLAKVGLITERDLADITRGLSDIQRDIESAPAGPFAVGVAVGGWPGWKTELEDVHMCIEAALIERIGDPGRKLHTGRSRNDQVALDLRLYLRDACAELQTHLANLMGAFEALAARQGDVLLPTYTHLQRAQPACVGAEAIAWWSMFERDHELFDFQATDPFGLLSSPLGSGAIAGSSLPLDRNQTAEDLGFAGPTISSIDSTASRDEALDFVYACSRTMLHLSRLAEQWIIYCTTEFGFLSLDPAHTTGSSMMPQKRNPDMLELIRGRAGNVLGSFTALASILKGLPIGYNRDLQEDKRHVFAAFDVTRDCLEMATRIVHGARFLPETIARAGGGLDRGYLDATALAEYFVRNGVPFRTAHQVVGALVRNCESKGRMPLRELALDDITAELARHNAPADAVGSDVYESLGAAAVVRMYQSFGHGGIGEGGYRDWLSRARQAERVVTSPARDDHSEASPKLNAASINTERGKAPESTQTPPLASPESADLFGIDDPGKSAGRDSAPHPDAALIDAYLAAGRSLDDLPYTPEFETILARIRDSAGAAPTEPQQLLRRLHNLRKAGKLPKLGRSAVQSTPARIGPEHEQVLAGLVIDATGTLGQRDSLPYTPAFEAIVSEFNQRTGRAMTPHDVWRLVAKLAK